MASLQDAQDPFRHSTPLTVIVALLGAVEKWDPAEGPFGQALIRKIGRDYDPQTFYEIVLALDAALGELIPQETPVGGFLQADRENCFCKADIESFVLRAFGPLAAQAIRLDWQPPSAS